MEGPDFYTFYHGRVRLGDNGEAWVVLPDYFEALNTTPQYQLTCVGGHAPVYVAEEVAGNRFKIAGGRPGLQVCWRVMAVRNDPYVRDHPYQAELETDPDEKGSYYCTEGYKDGKTQSIRRNSRAEIR